MREKYFYFLNSISKVKYIFIVFFSNKFYDIFAQVNKIKTHIHIIKKKKKNIWINSSFIKRIESLLYF